MRAESNDRRMFLLSLVAAGAAWPSRTALAAIDQVSVQPEGGSRIDVFRSLPLYRGVRSTVFLRGAGVERCQRIELGPDVVVPEHAIHRAAGSLVFDVVASESAPLGDRDLRLRFAIEVGGPETFPARILRNGEVRSVEPRSAALNETVVLTFIGAEIGNADVLASSAVRSARVLPGGTETRCQVEVVFIRTGLVEVPLYDRAGIPRPAARPDLPGGYRRLPAAIVDVRRSPV